MSKEEPIHERKKKLNVNLIAMPKKTIQIDVKLKKLKQ
jgi:hypothetical protein